MARKISKAQCKRLRKLLGEASPLPWTTDDGNVFSSPLTKARHKMIMAILQGQDVPHPDEHGEYPLGFVCSTTQTRDNFQADEQLIAAAVNALPMLLDLAEVVLGDKSSGKISDAVEEYRKRR